MKRLCPLALLAALLMALAPPSAPPAAAAGRIDPALAAQLRAQAPGDTSTVVVIMADQVAARTVTGKSRRERRRNLVSALKAKADQTQAKLRRDLDRWITQGKVAAYTPLWGLNALVVTADSATIQALASSAGVAKVVPERSTSAPLRPAAGSIPTSSLQAIHAPDLWALGYYGQGVVVANLDTGVDGTHPDLAPRYRGGSNSWFDPYGQHSAPYDQSGHGTWTMGVMVGGDSVGYVIGAAPEASWIAAKIFNDSGSATTSAIHQALQWVLDPDANPATDDAPDVVNNSWAFGGIGCDLTFAQDVQNLLAAGIVPVFAAGNYGPDVNTSTSPANNPGAFAVGAVNDSGAMLGLSSRGPNSCAGSSGSYPALVAPGSNVITTDLYQGYYTPSGTSLAAPNVAGGLALLLSAFPGLTAEQQRAALLQGATDLGAPGVDDESGAGMLNLIAAYQALAAGTVPTPTAAPTDTPTSALTDTPVPPTATSTATPTSTPTNTPVPPTATRTSTPVPPTATSAPSDAIFSDGFESGNLSRWSSAVGGSKVGVTSAAALAGGWGMQATINSTASLYVADLSPAAEPSYRARFRWSPNGVAIPSAGTHNLLSGYKSGGSLAFRVQLQYSSGSYKLRAGIIDNGGAQVYSNWYTVTNAAHTIEIKWQGASSASPTSGAVSLWIDGALKETKGGVANSAIRLEELRLGPISPSAGISGSEYFDDFASSRGAALP